MSNWPIYFSDNIHISNPESETGILCLWTKKERLIEKLDSKLYSFIGQLYSKDYGIMILIRNLLAKNDLRNLVLTGIDLNGSGKIIKSLFKNGIKNNGKIIGTDTFLDKELKEEHIDLLRKRINLIDLTNIKDFEELNQHLKIEKKGSLGENIILNLPELEQPRRKPTDFSGFKARALNFTDAYKKLINFILNFGVYNEEEKKLKVWNANLIAKNVNDQDKQFLGKHEEKKTTPKAHLSNKYFESYFFKKLDAWNVLQELAKKHESNNSLNVAGFELFIEEKDIESAYELVGNTPDSHVWDQDPHGSLIIRVENDLIRIIHLCPDGKVINEFCAEDAKTLYKKIIKDNKISLLSHALDIGGEIKRAEIALKKGEKFEQDKK